VFYGAAYKIRHSRGLGVGVVTPLKVCHPAVHHIRHQREGGTRKTNVPSAM
jgi:hypothetical protein